MAECCAREQRFLIAWDRPTVFTNTRYKTQLDLTEHTAIKTRNPSDSAPTCSLYTRYPIVARALGLVRRASKGILHTNMQ